MNGTSSHGARVIAKTDLNGWYAGLALAVLAALYLPFAFDGHHVFLKIHDNLDGEVVHSRVLGLFYRHPEAAQHLLLGGGLPITLLPRLTWPLSLINLLSDPVAAYAIHDAFVRLVAFAGMFLLTKHLGVMPKVALFAGLLFAVTLTYSVFGLSVAGLPLVIYLVERCSEGGSSKTRLGVLLLVGWNSALVFTGAFLLVSMPILRRVLFGVAKQGAWAAYLSYAVGLGLGSAGLFVVAAEGLALNRNDWLLAGGSGADAVKEFFANQFSAQTWDFYHVSNPLVFAYLAVLLAAALGRDRRLWFLVAAILFVCGLYSVVHLQSVARLRNQLGGIAKTFQIDRFYMLDSLLVVCGWALAAASPRKFVRRIALVLGGVQLAYGLTVTPQLRGAFEGLPRQGDWQSFEEYYRPADYGEINSITQGAITLSVGLDPMAAVMNGVSTLDGYYSAYPLAYKTQWRQVIEKQLKAAQRESYYDNWGNRIYTFVDSPSTVLLDYCAAYRMGARYVIAAFPLADRRLTLVRKTREHQLTLYSIGCERAQDTEAARGTP